MCVRGCVCGDWEEGFLFFQIYIAHVSIHTNICNILQRVCESAHLWNAGDVRVNSDRLSARSCAIVERNLVLAIFSDGFGLQKKRNRNMFVCLCLRFCARVHVHMYLGGYLWAYMCVSLNVCGRSCERNVYMCVRNSIVKSLKHKTLLAVLQNSSHRLTTKAFLIVSGNSAKEESAAISQQLPS